MNKCIFNGRLVVDPEIKFTQTNNTKVASIRIAVKRNYKNQNGEYDSDFFSLSAFGVQADLLEKYFKKGQEILVSSHAQQRSWETETGEKKYSTDFVIETIDFIGTKKDNPNSEEPNVNQAELTVNVVDNQSDDLPF